MDNEYILIMENISKSFPGVHALDNVQLKVRRGTVHSVMGENGAGKSTLMKILIGSLNKDSGTILFEGRPIEAANIHMALQQGISMIFQELNPIPNMTVAENIYVGREPLKGIFVDYAKMLEDTKQLLEKLDINNIKPNEKLKNLSASKTQLVEICKALSYNSKLIIMDEPTSALTENEIDKLFNIVKKLREEGVSFIFITHKMDEVFQISDDITVMRDGRYIMTKRANELTADELIYAMVGREISSMYPKQKVKIGDTVLSVRNFTCNGLFEDISFDVHSGEIFGLGGLMGAGRTELVESIFGYYPHDSGDIYIKGVKVNITTPKIAIKNGMALLTEDRKRTGLFLPLSVKDNILMPSLSEFIQAVFLNKKEMEKTSEEYVEKFNVRTPSINQTVVNLSGGNQQKALVARWLLTKPEIIILDEPTRGIDVGAKMEVHKIISSLAAEGKCVLLISSEMPELLGVCDRVAVMHEGKLTGVLEGADMNQVNIMQYAAGLKHK